MSNIVVPDLGESILEGTLLTWLKHVGDSVEAGEAVAELETDKVNLEIISEESGVIENLLREAGDTVEVGETVATVAVGGGAGVSGSGVGESGSSAGATAAASAAPDETGNAPSPDAAASSGRSEVPTRSTPAVRRLAKEQGVNMATIQGTGGAGRITEDDVRRAKTDTGSAHPAQGANQAGRGGQQSAAARAQGQPAAASPASGSDRPDEQRERMSRRRQTIAKRLLEVKQTTAMLTTFNEIDMSHMLDVRKRHKERFKEENDIGLGFMSFFSKATVGALKKFPRLNAEIDGQDMILKNHYDVGVAVSTEGGLVVPVVRDVDRLSFAQIEREIARLAKKARDNALDLSDLQGGTFTITNGGVFGSLFSTPILNAPQVGILGMHGIQQRPIAVDGEVVIRPMMYVALSYDHRIVDGAEAVSFLVAIKKMIEDPEQLLLQG